MVGILPTTKQLIEKKRFNNLQKYNENNNKYLLTLIIIKIVFWFSMWNGRGKVVGNGVVVLVGEQLIRMPKTETIKMIGQH